MCSSWTRALVRVDEVNAGASVLTGLRLTFIDLFGAVHTVVPRDTLPENQIPLGLFILKQKYIFPCTFSVIFILFPCMLTHLTTVSSQIIGTDGSILARIGRALVHLFLAVAPSVAGLASAVVSVSCIQTLARVSAQMCHLNP